MADLPPPPDGTAWPPGTYWAWRPLPWQGGARTPGSDAAMSGYRIAEGVTLFTEREEARISVAVPGMSGLVLRAIPEAGAFLSLAIDLPAEALAGLTRRSLVSLTCVGGRDPAGAAGFAAHGRINLRHGPNLARQTRPVRLANDTFRAVFDLAYAGLAHAAVSHAWVDLIFSEPGAMHLTLHDLALSCHPRAEI